MVNNKCTEEVSIYQSFYILHSTVRAISYFDLTHYVNLVSINSKCCSRQDNRALFIRKIKYTMLQNHKQGSGPLCGCHPCPLHSLYSSNNLIGYGVLINVDHSFCNAVNSDHKLYSQELNEGQEDEMDLKSGCCNQPLFINNIQSKFILVLQNPQGPNMIFDHFPMFFPFCLINRQSYEILKTLGSISFNFLQLLLYVVCQCILKGAHVLAYIVFHCRITFSLAVSLKCSHTFHDQNLRTHF